MEDVEVTYITAAHEPLGGARQLQERMGNGGEHTGYFVNDLE